MTLSYFPNKAAILLPPPRFEAMAVGGRVRAGGHASRWAHAQRSIRSGLRGRPRSADAAPPLAMPKALPRQAENRRAERSFREVPKMKPDGRDPRPSTLNAVGEASGRPPAPDRRYSRINPVFCAYVAMQARTMPSVRSARGLPGARMMPSDRA